MINFISRLFNAITLPRKLKKRSKRRGAIGIKTKHPKQLLKFLDTSNIDYVVLRMPDWMEHADFISNKGEDIDILIDIKNYRQLLPAAINFTDPDGIRFDIYSIYGVKGTGYRKFPLYPPLMAKWLMAQRTVNNAGVYVLKPKADLIAFTFHLVYQKALDSGLESGFSDISAIPAKSDYKKKLIERAAKAGVNLPSPLTLKNLATWLAHQDHSMPWDLLIRWSLQGDAFLKRLSKELHHELEKQVPSSDYIYAYMLREDLEGLAIEEKLLKKIEEKFHILEIIDIPKIKRESIAKKTRGGNWAQLKSLCETYPYKLIVCHDPNPRLMDRPDPDYPLADNYNFFYKKELREYLSLNTGKKCESIHGSDNIVEAYYMINTVKSLLEDNDD